MSPAYIVAIVVGSVATYVVLGTMTYTWLAHTYGTQGEQDEANLMAGIFWPIGGTIVLIIALIRWVHGKFSAWLQGPRVPRAVAREKEKP